VRHWLAVVPEDIHGCQAFWRNLIRGRACCPIPGPDSGPDSGPEPSIVCGGLRRPGFAPHG